MLNLLTSLAATAIILGKTEQIQLVREAQDTTDNDARHNLVQANIRLAHKVAKKHIRKGLDFNDLLACATEGILIAIDKFDVTKGASFTTYARMWMVAKCQEHVQANAGLVHCGSRTSKKLWSGLQKARKAIGVDAQPAEVRRLAVQAVLLLHQLRQSIRVHGRSAWRAVLRPRGGGRARVP